MQKQVICIRKDLKMRQGKSIAQGAHASIGAFKQASVWDIRQWELEGCTKICVYVNNEAELLELSKAASLSLLPTYLVKDAGRTEFHGEATYTALGIGPASSDLIDALTGRLPLL